MFLLVVSWAASALIVWSLFVALTRGVMRLRGGEYSRVTDPVRYWISVSLALIGLVLCLALAAVSSAGVLGLIA
jgi:hypothetical protein